MLEDRGPGAGMDGTPRSSAMRPEIAPYGATAGTGLRADTARRPRQPRKARQPPGVDVERPQHRDHVVERLPGVQRPHEDAEVLGARGDLRRDLGDQLAVRVP